MRASYTNFHIFDSKDANPALIGMVPTNTPSEIASIWGDYTLKSGQFTGFGFGGGVRYNGHSYADNINTLVVPSYVLGRPRRSLRGPKLAVCRQRHQHDRQDLCRQLPDADGLFLLRRSQEGRRKRFLQVVNVAYGTGVFRGRIT